ncbi:Fur-regulated basic protein FbpA [Niallia nealsonii]|uniref:Fur-regulated basic protein FbpA n=1 Tax=Niallia nealsonii TaxID=115979 RepID=A0A2N0Z300_9BACI|nr:Fur-regulated basic protein FbpA [Niallia nealsonii]
MNIADKERYKEQLIDLLLNNGIYKKGTFHLFELSVTELEEAWGNLGEKQA